MSTITVAAVSDIHNWNDFEIPKCDLLIVAGDITHRGRLNELVRFNQCLERQRQQFDLCLLTPGNHDTLFAYHPSLAQATLSNALVLIDQEFTYRGKRIWMSPWTPRYGSWSFMLSRGELIRKQWDLIPEGLDVLVTHGPPHGVLDMIDEKHEPAQSVGCEELKKALQALKQPPRHHVFGHIHTGYGKLVTEKTTYFNVALCDERYRGINPVQVFEI